MPRPALDLFPPCFRSWYYCQRSTGRSRWPVWPFICCFCGWSEKIQKEISKHHEIVTLAIAKRETANRLLSKALSNNSISDEEFQIILAEMEQYHALKKAVRAKLTRAEPTNTCASARHRENNNNNKKRNSR